MSESTLDARTAELARQHMRQIDARTNRLFSLLMAVQFVAGVVAAVVISPQTWSGV